MGCRIIGTAIGDMPAEHPRPAAITRKNSPKGKSFDEWIAFALYFAAAP